MRAVVQRVRSASVHIGEACHSSIHGGALVLLGVARGDTEADAEWISVKLSKLRIFDDAEGRMNEDVVNHGNAFLVVSQFTLFGRTVKGNRPGYTDAASPELAHALYESVVMRLRSLGHRVETGVFRANMIVRLENDGPVTLILDSCDA